MLINCIAYQDGKKLADVPISDINSYVNRPDCFVWVALKDGTDEELEHMRKQFGLHELAVEDARVGHQRPKVEEYGDSVFTVLHLIEVEDGRQLHIGEIDVFVGHNYILSVRNRSKQTFMGVRDRCEREPQLLKHGSGFVLYALIDAVVDRYFPIIDMLETELEEIEEGIFRRGTARQTTERLYALKQKVLVMKHAVMPLTEAVGKLYGGRVPRMCAGTQEYFRDVYDHLIRMNTTIDTIRDTIVTAIQVNLSVVAIEDNEVMKRLGAWAGIFAVATFFVGVWGMNFKNMPELDWVYGYPVALEIIAIACFTLYRVFRRAGWL